MEKSFTFIIAFLLTVCVYAQAPQKMSYQAVIRDANNNLVTNHVIGMRISIIQGSVTGTLIYVETQVLTTNPNGLITAEIGNGTIVSGIFTSINWANGPYFIKSETDPTGGTNYTISGISQLLSVPYALYAKTAENGFSGVYSDLTDKPVLWDSTYASIKNRPILFDGQYSSLTGKPTFSTIATTGNYNDLSNKPTLFSGIYSDLIGKPALWDSTWNSIKNKPILFDGQYSSLTGKPTFSTVATSGSYNDLSNKPTLFSGIYSDLTGKPALWDSTWNSIKNKPVFFDGQYISLTGKPTLWDSTWASIKNKPVFFDGQYNSLSGKPTFSLVATSGSYNDLNNKPTLSSVATSGSYNDLINKPTGNNIGDMQYWNGSAWVMIQVGQPGQFLQLNSTNTPSWSGGTFFPVVNTSPASLIIDTIATIGGNVTNDGGSSIIARGVCWSNSINPTINNPHTSNGTGTGSFVSLITGLTGGSTYYVRAYATNTSGTNYGENISLTTISNPVTDIDGNVYQTITIGTQIWMKQNLKTTKFNDGTNIPLVTSNSTWQNLTTAAYCWYNNNAATYKNVSGAIYNWYTVNSNKLCPIGWHIPSKSEWTNLINFYGGTNSAGNILKSGEFTAIMGGGRFSSDFIQFGQSACWWSSTEYDISDAWDCAFAFEQGSSVLIWDTNKKFGCSVRCVKY